MLEEYSGKFDNALARIEKYIKACQKECSPEDCTTCHVRSTLCNVKTSNNCQFFAGEIVKRVKTMTVDQLARFLVLLYDSNVTYDLDFLCTESALRVIEAKLVREMKINEREK